MKPTPIITLIADIAHQLHGVYKDPILCEQYAWWTLEAITGKKQAQLLIAPIALTDEQQNKLNEWLNKMTQEHMPIQYLIGSVPFNDLEILVEPPILIPRPETEEWCSNLADQLKKLSFKNLSILDMCSGTGCIALALAQALPHATIYASDINPQAVALGKKNAAHNAITNVTFLESDLFKAIPKDLRFDLIVANPPYIAPREWQKLDASVKNWEDPKALMAEHEGLAIIERIIAHAPHFIRPNHALRDHAIPQLVLEIDYDQEASVAALMKAANFNHVQIIKDLEGKPRVAQGRVDHVATASITS